MGGDNGEIQVEIMRLITIYNVIKKSFGFMLLMNIFFIMDVCAGDKCLEPEPKLEQSLAGKLSQAEKLLKNGDSRKALEYYEKHLIGLERKNHRAAFTGGRIYFLLNQYDSAENAFKSSIDLYPCFEPAWRNLAAVRYKKGKIEEAAEMLEKAWTILPSGNDDLLLQASIIRLETDKAEKAGALLDRCDSGIKRKKEWKTARVKVHIASHEFNKAHILVDQLIENEPENESFWRLASWLAVKTEQWGKAASALEIACRLKEPPLNDYSSLGGLFRKAGVPVKAAHYIKKSIKGDPTAEDCDLLSAIYYEAFDYENAFYWSDKAVKKEPSGDRYRRLGDLCIRLNNYTEALHAYLNADAAGFENADVWLKIGWIYWKKNDIPSAVNAYEKAVSMAERNSETYSRAASSLAVLKERLNSIEAE